jgi:hypothetical protein
VCARSKAGVQRHPKGSGAHCESTTIHAGGFTQCFESSRSIDYTTISLIRIASRYLNRIASGPGAFTCIEDTLSNASDNPWRARERSLRRDAEGRKDKKEGQEQKRNEGTWSAETRT